MRIPKLAAECGLTEQYEDVKITPVDGYVDGEWYAHQGVQVIEWPALENCVTIDAEACNELRAVFHMLGEQVPNAEEIVRASLEKDMAKTALDVERDVVMKLIGEQKPAPELLAKIDAWVARQPSKEPESEKVMPPPLVVTNYFKVSGPTDRRTQEQLAASVAGDWWAKHMRAVNAIRQAQTESATQPTEPQVRSRSAAAKSPMNGLFTEQSGRYCGLGYCDEE
jgi:hypothetical protein